MKVLAAIPAARRIGHSGTAAPEHPTVVVPLNGV
jgi:hypothetical protein